MRRSLAAVLILAAVPALADKGSLGPEGKGEPTAAAAPTEIIPGVTDAMMSEFMDGCIAEAPAGETPEESASLCSCLGSVLIPMYAAGRTIGPAEIRQADEMCQQMLGG